MLVPMSLRLTRPRRLMLISLAHDPVYGDIEVQWVDEPELGGQGIVLLAVRRADGTADVLVDERLRLPRADYDVAAGLASFHPARMQPARFVVDERGVDADVATLLPDGRSFHLTVRERLTGARTSVDMLAPAGHSMTQPRFFPFFWMGEIGFVRWRGAQVTVRVDGRSSRVVRVGVPWRLARYATAPMTALWNEAYVGPVPRGDLADLAMLEVRRDGHALTIVHDPPFPDVSAMPPGMRTHGRVTASVDGRAQLGGRYWARRDADVVRAGVDIDQQWDPGPQPAMVAAVFRMLTVFRTWPTTYRWRATIDLGADEPTLSGGWMRTA